MRMLRWGRTAAALGAVTAALAWPAGQAAARGGPGGAVAEAAPAERGDQSADSGGGASPWIMAGAGLAAGAGIGVALTLRGRRDA